MAIRRRPPERLAAWFATGPLGHLYALGADLASAWAYYALERLAAHRSGR